MYKPTAKGYFSGAGGMEIGLMDSGVHMVQSLDIDTDAVEAMGSNPQYFGHNILHVDIRDMRVKDQPRTDLIAGTYPCTKYSEIADIHGTRTGDDLFLHFFRHIAIEQPEMYLVENVPGMKKFPVVMEAMSQLPGYYLNIFCPVDASNWLPQQRERLIMIGTKRPFFMTQPGQARRRPTIADIMERDVKIDIQPYILSRLNGNYRDRPIIVDPESPSAIAPACLAHYSKDQGTRLIKDRSSEHGVRPFSIREFARLQGFPDDYKFKNAKSSYRLIGNAVAIPLGRWLGSEAVKYFN